MGSIISVDVDIADVFAEINDEDLLKEIRARGFSSERFKEVIFEFKTMKRPKEALIYLEREIPELYGISDCVKENV